MQLRVDDLVHVYPSGLRALDGVSLAVAPGTRLALLGANGAGKSTLVKHWNGLLRPTAGRVLLDGRDAATMRPAELAGCVAYMFQNPDDQLFGRRVRDEVAFGPRQLGSRGERLEHAVDEALQAVGLSELGDRHPFDLDYSQRKLVALACVLAMQTPVVALDEPTANLDAPTIARVSAALATRPHATIVAITHDVDWAAETFDRFLVLDAGRIVADGTGPEVLYGTWDAVEMPSVPYLAAGLGMSRQVVRVADFLAAYRPA